MRNPHLIVLLGLILPLVAAQVNLPGCVFSGSTDTGGTTAGGTLFNLPPTVRISVIPDPPRGVAPLTVQFDSSNSTDDGVIVDRLWDFGDGQTNRDIAPAHIFQTNGVYTVKLTLTDDVGASASDSRIVTVTERPIAVIQVDRDSADVAPARFEFDASASYDPDGQEGETLQYRWDFGDGAREVLSVVPHTYAAAGAYRVILTVTDATGVTGTAERLIVVGIPRPTITFRAPPASVRDLVCTRDPNVIKNSPLWVQVVFQVESGVPYKLRTGLRDTINGKEYLLDPDARDGVVSNDLPLTLPTALDISGVPAGTYSLWAEVLTDRSAPSRTYSSAIVHVVPPFTGTVTPDTPILPPLSNEEWYIIMEPSAQRQLFDLGSVSVGDRLFVSLVNTPGYGQIYQQDGFSLQILDAAQRLFAWYDAGLVLFTPNTRLIVGRNSNHFYVVSDATSGALVPNVYVRIQRGAAADSEPRQQVIYLNFNGTGATFISAANSKLFALPAFSLRSALSDSIVIGSAVSRVQSLLAPYNFVVVASTPTSPASPPVEPHNTLFFDTSTVKGLLSVVGTAQLQFFGLSDYVDPHNATAVGQGVIAVRHLDDTMTALGFPLSDTALGTAIGNAAIHQIGLMAGLRETTRVNTDVMVQITAANQQVAKDAGLDFTVADLAPLAGQTSVLGVQDVPLLLRELFR